MARGREKGRAQAGPTGKSKDRAPGTLAVDVRLSHVLLKPHTPELVWALVQLESPPVPGKRAAKLPVNVGFVPDTSGCMTRATARGLRVTLKSGVAQIRAVVGYEEKIVPGAAPGIVALDLPDMYENERRILVVELAVSSLPHSRPYLLEVTVVYNDVLRGIQSATLTARVSVPVAKGPAELYKPDAYVRKVVELTRTAAAKDRALAFLDEGNVDDARAILKERLEALRGLETASDPDVTAEIRNLESLLSQDLTGDVDAFAVRSLRKGLWFQS